MAPPDEARRSVWIDQAGTHWRQVRPHEVLAYLTDHAPVFVGYGEARAGRPLDSFAFAGDDTEQAHYENGRALVFALRGAGIEPPEWRQRAHPTPTLLRAVMRLVEGAGDD
ncbi:hypothetical protein [Parvibaculum sp.]|uniref:hypothetical protein n=1 Tax=Parvibaculum sp. TaxID=2024848 RepID=UPI00260F537B|nr:hypothetical protein [Parvibaculum sp.]MCW5727233.1 hypothetical protein [Parvibaculum sp.]